MSIRAKQNTLTHTYNQQQRQKDKLTQMILSSDGDNEAPTAYSSEQKDRAMATPVFAVDVNTLRTS
jgi:hypothetical protein